ncbi:MAG: hypothetical protein FJ399_21940, partial [Verrucomicrobia bacterium]|nr:hypothetical protein [Verrucomicrobiota bacterium]
MIFKVTPAIALLVAAFCPALWAASSEGLVGHWRFDEGSGAAARDSAGANHGSVRGGKWSKGVAGTALRLEVSRDQVEVPAAPNLEMTDALTIALWLRSENFDTPLVNKLQYWTPGNFDFRLERNGALVLGHEIGSGGRRQSRYESTVQLAAHRWYHVAVTLKVGGEVRFYVDGGPAGTLPQTGTLAPAPAEPVRIGAKPDPYSSFRGDLDELRLYRRELTAAEVQELAAEFTPPPATVAAAQPAAITIDVRTTAVTAAAPPAGASARWPQWRGPARDGKSPETDLLQSWPAGGPPLLWFAEGLGDGFSTVSIAEGRIYTTGMIAQREVLFALDLQGRLLWHQAYGPAWHGRYSEARTTPTVDTGRVYVTSGLGRVACFDARTGAELWVFDAAKEFGATFHFWGIAESPLIVGARVICTPCGTRATFAALDKKNGRVIWASPSLGEETGYSSPIAVALPERTVIISMLNKSIAGVDAANGGILWRLMYSEYQTSPHGINPNTPVYHD